MDARTCADGAAEMGGEKDQCACLNARTCADGVGARDRGTSEHGCADVCEVQGKWRRLNRIPGWT